MLLQRSETVHTFRTRKSDPPRKKTLWQNVVDIQIGEKRHRFETNEPLQKYTLLEFVEYRIQYLSNWVILDFKKCAFEKAKEKDHKANEKVCGTWLLYQVFLQGVLLAPSIFLQLFENVHFGPNTTFSPEDLSYYIWKWQSFWTVMLYTSYPAPRKFYLQQPNWSAVRVAREILRKCEFWTFFKNSKFVNKKCSGKYILFSTVKTFQASNLCVYECPDVHSGFVEHC